MAMKKSEKKKIRLDAKKIERILCFAFLTIALLVGIIFSSVKVNMDMIYGPEYNGAYQASVQAEQKGSDKLTVSLSELAESLSDKLAPFSDKSVTVSKQGENHLNVIASKKDYESNETYLRNQIESNGGLFTLNYDSTNGYQDWYLHGKKANNTQRFTSSDFFTGKDVKTKTLSNGAGRDPFVQLGLNGTAFVDALNAETTPAKTQGNVLDETSKYANLTFVTDLQELVDTLRYFYVVNNSPEAINIYWNDVIKPIQTMMANTDKPMPSEEKEVLRNLFSGTVNWTIIGRTFPYQSYISLLDTDFTGGAITVNPLTKKTVSGINGVNDLKNILPLFTPNNTEMPTSKFIYSPDASFNDVTQNTFKDWFTGINRKFTYDKDPTMDKTFGWVVNTLLNKNVLFGTGMDGKVDKSESTKITPAINKDFIKYAPQLGRDILYSGDVSSSTSKEGVNTSISGEVERNISFVVDNAPSLKQDGSGVKNAFYLRTKNLTAGKMAVASIKQNALGVNFLVESISSVNPYITSVMYITSVVFLSVIALLLAIYILFVYRLMGLFTIIIAACSIAITLLAAVGFGIGMGPQVIAALFLITALIMDTSFILFESWKDNYYEKKHGILSSLKIGNRETLSMAVDTILVAFIPNIVLFWAATGPLKTFGTLSIIGVGLAVVVGILIGRAIYWLILRSKLVQKTDWLLPVDTRYTSLATLKYELVINKYSNFLENHEGKTNYSTKELEQISKAKDKLAEAKKAFNIALVANNSKVEARDERTLKYVKKSTDFLTRLRTKLVKMFRIKHPEKNIITRTIDGRLEDNNMVLGIEKEADKTDSTNKSKLRDKGRAVRADRMVSRAMIALLMLLVLFGIIAAIVGGVAGVRWENGVGYGQQFVVYGTQVNTIHDNLGTTRFSLPDKAAAKWKEINDYYDSQPDSEKGTSSKDTPSDSQIDTQRTIKYAYELRDFFKYLDKTNQFTKLGETATTKKINLKKATIDVVLNFRHMNSDSDMIALRINSSATNKASRSAMKRLLVAMSIGGYWPNAGDMKDKGYDGNGFGIDAYDLSPYTVSEQIRNVGIAFGIALAILVAYIFIRFKWTYYVALALGLGLVIGTVIALVVICRVPMSTEMLCGMAFVITFALTSMILVLGRGKSKLNLESKENVEKNFNGSIALSAEMRTKKAQTQAVYVPMRKRLVKLWFRIAKLKIDRFIHRSTFGAYDELNDLITQFSDLKNDYKVARKEQTGIYKAFKAKTKFKQNELQRNNWYFKTLFATLIKYSAWRMATLGVFYLLVGIILAATLPSIFGMGLTIVFGLLAGFSIALFFAVPVWVYFEKRRIRFVFGRKKYIESLKVSNEEEIVKGIND